MKAVFKYIMVTLLLALIGCDGKKPTDDRSVDRTSKKTGDIKDLVKAQPQTPSKIEYNPHEVMEKVNEQIKPSLENEKKDGSNVITEKVAKEATQTLINNATQNANGSTKKAMEDAAQSARDAAEMMDRNSK
jgi:hypothetical protein